MIWKKEEKRKIRINPFKIYTLLPINRKVRFIVHNTITIFYENNSFIRGLPLQIYGNEIFNLLVKRYYSAC